MAKTLEKRLSRRNFSALTVIAGVSGSFRFSARGDGPNDRLQVGFIGVGTMGRGHLGAFLGDASTQVISVCDVVRERRADAKERVEKRYAGARKKGSFAGCSEFVDFRELLAKGGVDAVVIATPDHWHSLQTILAAAAKKHVYCEKPLTRTIGEGRRLVEAVAKAGICFQTGSQQRSEFGGRFRQAAELVRNGRVGKLKTIRIGVGGPAVACDLPAQPVPDGTDWERWVGPAALRPYNEILCPRGIHKHFPAWRNYREYAGGGLADMGAHHFDIAQWALDMDASGPISIEPPTDPKANAGLRYVYANGVEMFHGGEADCVFVGDRGVIRVSRDKIGSEPKNLLTDPLPAGAVKLYRADSHRRNWLDSIRSGKPPICPSETGHRSASICHLGNIGYQVRRKLTWDPKTERFAGDEAANALVDPAPRAPWLFPS
ncbi:MAG TPA: Gfo/Idh/MocA family oxidoreductase [Planctomycetia bacterium]|nr:Gfo/Idh/MocA family oxidoreductase [Planctomycetia bacterium]